VKLEHIGGCSGPAAERSALLYDFIKRKRYISSQPPFKNILELFARSLTKPDSAGAGKGGCERPGPTSAASHSTIPL
jgi:hypothetical protein